MKKMFKIFSICLVMFLLTGCVSNVESAEIREFLHKKELIPTTWVYEEEYFISPADVFPDDKNYSIYRFDGAYHLVRIESVGVGYQVDVYENIQKIEEENPRYHEEGNIGEQYYVNYVYDKENVSKSFVIEKKKLLFIEYFKVVEEQA